ncbi:MAG TPA: hypothetical protein VMG12_05120 [Polyangiaceae bacterium]|nr:hypothetical protein [Polyangiaceae bacterium]
MSKYRHWAALASAGALLSACQLGLEGRACGVSDKAEAGICTDGYSCCDDDVCRRDCSEGNDGPSAGNSDGSGETNPPIGSTAQPDAGPPQSSDDGSPTSVGADVGPEGGAFVLGGASVHVPSGALPAVTALELSTTDLPTALPTSLPLAHDLASSVYRLTSTAPLFREPVTIEVPVASSFPFLMVLELGDVGWEPVSGASFVAATGADPYAEGPAGSVRWSSSHAGYFVVVEVGNRSSMDIVLGDTPYSYHCDAGGGGGIATTGDNSGLGPAFSTQNTAPNVPECPWPTTEPGLWLDVLFRNFLPSEGPAVGAWDLAAPESILPLRVEFIASVEKELPIGQQRPFQYYDSTTPIEGASGPIPDVTYQGFYQSPLASGGISVTRLTTVENTGYSSQGEFSGVPPSLYLIELSEVTLGATDQFVANPDDPFPPTVTISSATLMHAL